MPRQTPSKTPASQDNLQAELNKFADSAEMREIAFIKALSQSLQDKMLEYYRAGASAEERLQHLEAIIQAFRKIKLKGNGQEFTIAAKQVKSLIAGVPAYTCTPPQVCIGGACVLPGGGESS